MSVVDSDFAEWIHRWNGKVPNECLTEMLAIWRDRGAEIDGMSVRVMRTPVHFPVPRDTRPRFPDTRPPERLQPVPGKPSLRPPTTMGNSPPPKEG